MCKTGNIFHIQRFSTSDGPGIRTVVFLKGCPLNCVWCHNPESKSTQTEILYKQDLCLLCGSCAGICPNSCHTFENGLHSLHRERCDGCGQCVQVCSSKALEICGEEKTAEEIMDTVLRDKPFYAESGGGMTLSGGEPLMQYDFALSLLNLAKGHGLHTAIETSGFTTKDLTELNPYTDLWLYDIKLFSEEEHRKYTGVSNRQIRKNLHLLDQIGANIVLRCPIIPNINMTDEHFDALAELAAGLKHVTAIHLEPYHPLGLSKAQQLSRKQPYQNDQFLEAPVLQPYADQLRAKTDTEVIIL